MISCVFLNLIVILSTRCNLEELIVIFKLLFILIVNTKDKISSQCPWLQKMITIAICVLILIPENLLNVINTETGNILLVQKLMLLLRLIYFFAQIVLKYSRRKNQVDMI